MNEMINEIDLESLKKQIQSARYFPHFSIDDFLKEDFANEIYNSFPSYEDALKNGRRFSAINETRKVQVTNSDIFPGPLKKLNDLLASDEFLNKLRYLFDLTTLEADPKLVGGGIHQTDSGGRLDVHVDFNFIEDRELHRRLNLLLYFNKDWKEEYGGYLELWDPEVKERIGYFEPRFNRLCGFVTNDISFHGVTPLKCPSGVVRKSFATYYYTKEAPQGWDGTKHSTIFKSRPDEYMRNSVVIPLNKFRNKIMTMPRRIKHWLFK